MLREAAFLFRLLDNHWSDPHGLADRMKTLLP